LLAESVPSEPLGAHRLKDFPQPEPLHCAVIDGHGAAAFPAPRTESTRPTNLPAGTPTLIGRDEDLARVRTALIAGRERIVTLTGRGGSGKTTLALTAAAELLDEFAGGVWLVRLATVAATDLADAVASAVGATVETEGSSTSAIVARLRRRGRTLLVLDNLEHLLDAGGEIATLLADLPELQVLATSQVPLRLGEELIVALDALADDAALALIERVARRRNPAISLGGRERDALLELVHLLDGLPLALEVAAARLALLSPSQMLARLRESPDILRDDRSDRPERQRSLRATVEWSLGLLDAAPRALFTRLGVFAAPVELEELEAVCGADGLDVVSELFRLLEVALVRRVESGDGRVRFGLPEGLRQIAAEELERSDDGERWRRAHGERQREIVWPARELAVSDAEYEAAVAAIPERRAALRWAAVANRPLAQALAAGHAIVAADLGQLREAIETVEPLIADPPEELDVVTVACLGSCWALFLGRPSEGAPLADRAVAMATDPRTRVSALVVRALIYGFIGRIAEGLADNEQAVALAAPLGGGVLGIALLFEAQAHLLSGQLALARERLEAGRPLLESSGIAAGWKRFTVEADLLACEGRLPEALAVYGHSLREAERRSNDLQILFDLAGVAAALGDLAADESAIEIEAMTQVLSTEVGGPADQIVHILDRSSIGRARERLGPAAVAAAEARGRAVAVDRRVDRAIELAQAAVDTTAAVPPGDAISPAGG
jgi:predicted ATPase